MILNLILIVQSSCSQNYKLVLKSDSIPGMSNNSPVLIDTITIGKIVDMKLDADNNIIISIEIYNNFQIPNNSIFFFKQLDLMGNYGIGIKKGDSKKFFNRNDIVATFIKHENLNYETNKLQDTLLMNQSKKVIDTLTKTIIDMGDQIHKTITEDSLKLK